MKNKNTFIKIFLIVFIISFISSIFYGCQSSDKITKNSNNSEAELEKNLDTIKSQTPPAPSENTLIELSDYINLTEDEFIAQTNAIKTNSGAYDPAGGSGLIYFNGGKLYSITLSDTNPSAENYMLYGIKLGDSIDTAMEQLPADYESVRVAPIISGDIKRPKVERLINTFIDEKESIITSIDYTLNGILTGFALQKVDPNGIQKLKSYLTINKIDDMEGWKAQGNDSEQSYILKLISTNGTDTIELNIDANGLLKLSNTDTSNGNLINEKFYDFNEYSSNKNTLTGDILTSDNTLQTDFFKFNGNGTVSIKLNSQNSDNFVEYIIQDI